MAGSKAVAVVVGGAALAGIAALALAGNAKAASGAPPKPPKPPKPPSGGGTAAPSMPTGAAQIPAGQIPGPWAPPYVQPSTIPGVPPVTITPGNPGALANELATHLSALQLSKGGVAGARGKENKTLVKSFQQSAKLTDDGLTGPATLIAVARRGTGVLPLVMYWPKGADQKTVAAYRTAIRAIAADAPAAVGEALRASADREKGQALGSANVKK